MPPGRPTSRPGGYFSLGITLVLRSCIGWHLLSLYVRPCCRDSEMTFSHFHKPRSCFRLNLAFSAFLSVFGTAEVHFNLPLDHRRAPGCLVMHPLAFSGCILHQRGPVCQELFANSTKNFSNTGISSESSTKIQPPWPPSRGHGGTESCTVQLSRTPSSRRMRIRRAE